jgi:cellobiose phosphorylase
MATAAMGNRERAWELFGLINPIAHGSTPEQIATYRVEPYVVAADVYGVAPHTGRGGWTWYTGSAGWMYRMLTESLLGLQLEVDKLRFAPCVPSDWESFRIHYRYRDTFYHITIHGSGTAANARIRLDGEELTDNFLTLVDDHHDHHVEVEL